MSGLAGPTAAYGMYSPIYHAFMNIFNEYKVFNINMRCNTEISIQVLHDINAQVKC